MDKVKMLPSYLRTVLDVQDKFLLVHMSEAVVSAAVVAARVLERHLRDDVAEVGVNEPPAVLPPHAVRGGLAVHRALHLRRVIELHTVRIVGAHRDYGEIWKMKC